MVVLDIIGLFSQNSGGIIAHFGGYIIGYYYAVQFQKGIDLGEFVNKFTRFLSFLSFNLKTVYKKNNKNDSSLAGKKKKEFDSFTRQKQIDLILDKISKSGYESLTQLEKDFLFRAGK